VVRIAVHTATPNAPAVRCTTLLNALAVLACQAGMTARPELNSGIMAIPRPAYCSINNHMI